MYFFYYLSEIRYRLFYLGISFLLTFFTCYYYSLELIYLFARPFLHSKHHSALFDKGFMFTNLSEALNTTLKICFIWSFLLFLPFLFYQFWCFFTPSWFFFESARVSMYVLSATVCVFLGGFTFYFLVLPFFLEFLLNFKMKTPLFTVQLEASMDSYVSVSTGVFLMVECFFQTPLLFSLLYFFGYVDSMFLSKNSKIFVFFILFLSALLSPPDPFAEFLIFSFFMCSFELFVWMGFFIKNLCDLTDKKS